MNCPRKNLIRWCTSGSNSSLGSASSSKAVGNLSGPFIPFSHLLFGSLVSHTCSTLSSWLILHTLRPHIHLYPPPTLPGIFCPGHTRLLSLPDPIHPGLLCDFVVPWVAGIPWNPHLFMTPWKPLSIVLPLTSTHCPTVKWLAVSLVPGWIMAFSETGNLARCRFGISPDSVNSPQ